MNKSKLKEVINLIWTKCFSKQKDERLHAIAMLVLFGIFIVILVALLRTDSSTPLPNAGETSRTPEVSQTPEVSTEELEEDGKIDETYSYEINYSYLYTFTRNGIVEEVITGRRLDDKEIFTIVGSNSTTDYARLSDNYLKKEQGKYKLIERPSNNLLYANLDPLIDTLYSLNPTSIEANRYTYQVSTKNLLDLYHPDSTLVASPTSYNTVVITQNNNLISKIDVDFSNLATLLNGLSETYTMSLEFNNVGTTEDFNISIN